MRILLAEDDPSIAALLTVILTQVGGHQVMVAPDGDEALAKATAQSFDLLLLDGRMPKRNGVATCLAYRAQGGSAPVIFLSASSQPEEIADFLSHGLGYIQKPFDPLQVLADIERLIRKVAS